MRGKLLSYAIVVTLIGTLGLTGCKNFWKLPLIEGVASEPAWGS
jgi:hypothetical protein